MGFSNTQYSNTIENLVKASETKLVNPYYKFSDKKPTSVVYYKQNKTKSTLDDCSDMHYAHVSDQSALRFNKIVNFQLYGLPAITLDYDVGDNGLEAGPITGDCIVLPNTIEPLVGDFFSIPYIKEDVLFKVDSVTPDTLDNGANIYKIEYHLELTNSTDDIEKQVVATYQFMAEYVGTEFNCMITSDDYNLASSLSSLIEQLATYFNSIFYKHRLQTYVYLDENGTNFYDPYMIEFIRRNKILCTDDKFTYVAHQTTPGIIFPYEYAKSFFHALEKRDKSELTDINIVSADLITDINSLFSARIEDYYQIKLLDNTPFKTKFPLFDQDIINAIKWNKKYSDTNKNSIFNLVIDYMNGAEDYISDSIIDQIHKMEFVPSKNIFYLIPIYIYIIRSYIASNILSSQTIN